MKTYLLGCLIFYIIVRILRKVACEKEESVESQWIGVKINYFGMILSWLGVIAIICAVLVYLFQEVLPNYFKNKKPPKWL